MFEEKTRYRRNAYYGSMYHNCITISSNKPIDIKRVIRIITSSTNTAGLIGGDHSYKNTRYTKSLHIGFCSELNPLDYSCIISKLVEMAYSLKISNDNKHFIREGIEDSARYIIEHAIIKSFN